MPQYNVPLIPSIVCYYIILFYENESNFTTVLHTRNKYYHLLKHHFPTWFPATYFCIDLLVLRQLYHYLVKWPTFAKCFISQEVHNIPPHPFCSVKQIVAATIQTNMTDKKCCKETITYSPHFYLLCKLFYKMATVTEINSRSPLFWYKLYLHIFSII